MRESGWVLLGFVVALLGGCSAKNSGGVGTPCSTQVACGPGLVCDCNTGTCQPADKGNPYCAPPDARVFEAAVPDASWDAGQVDASAEDAQAEDAAVFDAGGDASETDAFPSDAALEDACVTADASE